MGEARRRKLAGNTAPKDPKRKYRNTTPSSKAKYLVLGNYSITPELTNAFGSGLGRR